MYHENDIHLKQELHGLAKERDELLAEVDVVKRKAKQDATNAKAAFDARQKALRDEIQSIWNVVKAISQSSPSKGELMERILELGENQGETTDESGATDAKDDDGEDTDLDQPAANDDNDDDDDDGDDGKSMTKTNNGIGADQDDKITSKPAGVSAMSSQQRTIGPVIDQDTISAISENTSMWDEELDLDGIDVTGDEDLDDALAVTHSISIKAEVDNDGSIDLLGDEQEDNKWLAEIDDEVRALEEECKALGLQFEDGDGETQQ